MNNLYNIAEQQSKGPGNYMTSLGHQNFKDISNENFLRGSDVKLSGNPVVVPMKSATSKWNGGVPESISTKTAKTCSFVPFGSDRLHPTLKPFAYVDKRLGLESRFDSR